MNKRLVLNELKERIGDGKSRTLKRSIETHSYDGYFNGRGDYDDVILSIRRKGSKFFCKTAKKPNYERELTKFDSWVVYAVAWELLSNKQKVEIALEHLYSSKNWSWLKNC